MKLNSVTMATSASHSSSTLSASLEMSTPVFTPETGEIADILTDNGRVDIDSADDLRAVLMQIAKNVLAHLAAAILYNLNLFHKKFLPSHKDDFVCGTPRMSL